MILLTNWYHSLGFFILDIQTVTTRFDLEKFNGENDLYLWSLKMHAVLIQQGLCGAFDID